MIRKCNLLSQLLRAVTRDFLTAAATGTLAAGAPRTTVGRDKSTSVHE